MKRSLLFPLLTAALGLSGLSGCGPIPNTGFQIIITPPDQTQLLAGTNYDTLYVDVVADSAEQHISIPIAATTAAPYKVVVLMDGVVHHEAQQITVSLNEGSVVILSQTLPNEAVTQDKLTDLSVDFANQGT